MFFRKLLGSNDPKVEASRPPAGMQTMGASLQRRFAKGVQYNMKIIIKGDRNVGKSCLFHRLQGFKFVEEYLPTDEIQVASIHWNYKTTDDVVKVEVWDVVDKGKKKKKIDGLKLDTALDGTYEDPCLDAEFLDVYKGTHGVILMYDITKQWTFDYLERELPKIPPQLPVLVLANHRDMGHHRTVTEDQAKTFIENLERPEGSAMIRYCEASMRNGFGLKYVHRFFNLPFLQLQRESLLQQLETNTREMDVTNQELMLQEESDEQNYDIFLDEITQKRRQHQEKLSKEAVEKAKQKQEDEKNAAELAAAQQNGLPQVAAPTSATKSGLREAPPARPIPGLNLSVEGTKSSSKSLPATPATTPASEQPKQTSLISKMFGSKPKSSDQEPSKDALHIPKSTTMPSVRSVEDFVPDEGLDAAFLDDAKEVADNRVHADGSSSDEEAANPMVAGFQDDLDSDDDVPVSAAVNYVVSSDEDDLSPAVIAPQRKTLSNKRESVDIKSSSSEEQPCASSVTPVEITKNEDDSEEESDEETPAVVIKQDEDISSEEDQASPPPKINGTHKKKSSSEDVDEAPALTINLNMDDLDFLEKRSDTITLPRKESISSDMAASSSRQDTDTDIDSVANGRKKHKHRSKASSKDEEKSSKKKHKKSKDKEENKKKKKKSKNTEDNDLEKFLGGCSDVEVGKDAAYESL